MKLLKLQILSLLYLVAAIGAEVNNGPRYKNKLEELPNFDPNIELGAVLKRPTKCAGYLQSRNYYEFARIGCCVIFKSGFLELRKYGYCLPAPMCPSIEKCPKPTLSARF